MLTTGPCSDTRRCN